MHRAQTGTPYPRLMSAARCAAHCAECPPSRTPLGCSASRTAPMRSSALTARSLRGMQRVRSCVGAAGQGMHAPAPTAASARCARARRCPRRRWWSTATRIPTVRRRNPSSGMGSCCSGGLPPARGTPCRRGCSRAAPDARASADRHRTHASSATTLCPTCRRRSRTPSRQTPRSTPCARRGRCMRLGCQAAAWQDDCGARARSSPSRPTRAASGTRKRSGT